MGGRPRLENSPLVEVVYELRFPGAFAVTSGLQALQDTLRAEFPRLLVPPSEEGVAIALKPYRFSATDGGETVAIAINSFALMSSRYTVFADFRRRFEQLYGELLKLHRPAHFTRLGLRFINALPAVEGVSPSQLHPWLSLSLPLPPRAGQVVDEFQGTALLTVADGVKLRIIAGHGQRQRAVERGLQVDSTFGLDFDCYREGMLSESRVLAFLDEAHDAIESVFFDLVTPEGLAAMGGAP